MRRIEAIGESPVFLRHIHAIEAAEVSREFCRHGLSHALDVARIAWILVLERERPLSKDVVYAAALLHDLGRSEQYATGEDHDVAGARIAAEVIDGLPERLRFEADERAMIIAAVAGHRGACDVDVVAEGRQEMLIDLIKESDNRSRACYACSARAACYWSDERKNLNLSI